MLFVGRIELLAEHLCFYLLALHLVAVHLSDSSLFILFVEVLDSRSFLY